MIAKENKIIPIDAPKESLTPEILRTFKGLENVSDSEANEIIISLRAFAALVFEYYKLKQRKSSSAIIDVNDINYNNNKKQAA